MKISVFLSLVLTGSSFSAVSLLNKQAMSEEFKVEEKVVQGDPSLGAVKAFNEGNYLAAVLRARSLAEEGNMYGLLVMGLAYEKGKGIEPSTELALTHYRKAREAGSAEAAYRLVGLLISAGSDDQRKEAREVLESLVKDDDGKAARLIGEGMLKGWFGGDPEFNKIQSWWEAAAEKGDVSAMMGLARLHDGEFGFPEKRNPQSALQEYQRAAKWGHAPAMTILGARLLQQDEKEGRKWLAKAIEGKESSAYLVLGDFTEKVIKDDALAYQEYLKGAEAGHGQCMLKVGSFLADERAPAGDRPKDDLLKDALGWFKKAGAAGQILGHVQAAKILLQGEGLDVVEGYNHLVVAADSGLVDLQNELGLLYISGRLGVRDASAAAGWFRRATEGKSPAGAFNLASLYEQGMGVPQNYDQAGRLYTLAANSGHARSTTALGRFHAEGRGTKQNLPQAWALFSLAVERGDESAKGLIEQVGRNLDAEGLIKAQEFLAEFQKAPKPGGG
ncbi:MAG: tetratricopeptide repeat protein [Akkermansiaceae bacterium]